MKESGKRSFPLLGKRFYSIVLLLAILIPLLIVVGVFAVHRLSNEKGNIFSATANASANPSSENRISNLMTALSSSSDLAVVRTANDSCCIHTQSLGTVDVKAQTANDKVCVTLNLTYTFTDTGDFDGLQGWLSERMHEIAAEKNQQKNAEIIKIIAAVCDASGRGHMYDSDELLLNSLLTTLKNDEVRELTLGDMYDVTVLRTDDAICITVKYV